MLNYQIRLVGLMDVGMDGRRCGCTLLLLETLNTSVPSDVPAEDRSQSSHPTQRRGGGQKTVAAKWGKSETEATAELNPGALGSGS